MNVKHVWTIICRKTIQDASTNNVSLMDVLEQVSFLPPKEIFEKMELNQGKPFGLPIEYEIVSMWEREVANEDTKGGVVIKLQDPNGRVLQEIAHIFQFKPGIKRWRLTGKIRGLRITTPGVYRFNVYHDENNSQKEVASIPLEVLIQPQ